MSAMVSHEATPGQPLTASYSLDLRVLLTGGREGRGKLSQDEAYLRVGKSFLLMAAFLMKWIWIASGAKWRSALRDSGGHSSLKWRYTGE